MRSHIDSVKDGLKTIEDGMRLLSAGPVSFSLEVLLAAHDALITKYAPFKAGQRVVLTKAPDFSKAPGWSGREHFMVPNAPATVHSVECNSDGSLRYYLTFDHETWKDREGKEQLVDRKGVYGFSEDFLATYEVAP